MAKNGKETKERCKEGEKISEKVVSSGNCVYPAVVLRGHSNLQTFIFQINGNVIQAIMIIEFFKSYL